MFAPVLHPGLQFVLPHAFLGLRERGAALLQGPDHLDQLVAGIEGAGAPEARSAGFWNNHGQCCGDAGVGEFALLLARRTGKAEYLDLDTYGLVGEVKKVNLAPIEASLQAGSIPVITSLGETPSGQILNINADFAANELVQELQPYKIIFLTGTGGLLDENGKVIDSINLSTEYEHLMSQPWINGGMRVKIEQIKDLLGKLPLTSSVSITRPADLAKELFTHKGSGTLVRRGESVLRATSWDELDLPRLRTLIESSFGRTLLPDYFEKTKLLRAYVSENYRTAVILTDEAEGVYLDKFAVLDDAQGEGLGRAVWNVMHEETPKLFWRSRHNNPVNIFYYAVSDGCFKQEKWKVFWYGIEDFSEVERCVAHCRGRAPTLVD